MLGNMTLPSDHPPAPPRRQLTDISHLFHCLQHLTLPASGAAFEICRLRPWSSLVCLLVVPPAALFARHRLRPYPLLRLLREVLVVQADVLVEVLVGLRGRRSSSPLHQSFSCPRLCLQVPQVFSPCMLHCVASSADCSSGHRIQGIQLRILVPPGLDEICAVVGVWVLALEHLPVEVPDQVVGLESELLVLLHRHLRLSARVSTAALSLLELVLWTICRAVEGSIASSVLPRACPRILRH